MPPSRSKCEKKGRVYVKKHKAYKDGPEIKSQCRKKSRKSKSRTSKSRKSKSRKSKSRKSRKSEAKASSKDSAKKEFRSLVRELCKKETPGETPGEPRSFQFASRAEPSARRPFDEIDNSMLGVFDY